MTLPIHCLKPMPDWGISLTKKKPLPTHEEIADAFSQTESFNRRETGNFIIRLSNEMCRRLLVTMNYELRLSDMNKLSRVLNLTRDMYSKDADDCLPWELRCVVNKASEQTIAEGVGKIYQLSMASQNQLLKQYPSKGSHPLLIDIANLLAVIEYDIVAGDQLGREIERRKKGCSATYQPDKYMICYKALMVDLAERMGVKNIKVSTEMLNGVGALVNGYLKIRRDGIHNECKNKK